VSPVRHAPFEGPLSRVRSERQALRSPALASELTTIRYHIMQTKAIIIKKQNTSEYDQWVTCYTEEFGKLKTVAKSILKSGSIQSLHLDIFNLAEFELINGRGMPIVTGAQMINSFGGIKSSLVKTAVAYFFTETLDKMVFENEKDEELWSFLASFLGELNKDDSCPVNLLRQGQSRLLDILGYLPETGSCQVCDDKLSDGDLGAFNYALGGIVCKKCFLSGHGGILISREDFNLISGKNGKSGDEIYKKSVLDGIFEYISGNKFSSLDFLSMVR